MTCRQFQRLLLQDNDLNEDQWQQLFAHLERCDACREFRDQLNTLSRQFESLLPVPEPRYGFAGRVLARIPNENDPQVNSIESLLAFLRPAPMALAAASLAMGIFLAAQITSVHSNPAPTGLQTTLFAEFFDVAPSLAFDQSSLSPTNDQER